MRRSPSKTAGILFLTLLFAAAPGRPARAEGPPQRDARLNDAYRVERAGWVYVHLEGPPDRIGFQHGYLLSREIVDLLRVAAPYFEHTTGRDWGFYRTAAKRMLWPRIDEEFRAEIDGIVAGLKARGARVDRWDVVALNASEELPYYYAPWLDRKEGKAPISHAPGNCSAFIATGGHTKNGRIVIGHNAWTNYVIGTRWNIVFDIAPEKGARILMDGLPGVITSDDDFGVTSAGMLITETTITQFEGWDPDGKPEFVRSRKAMQYARSIDDYVRIMLDGNNGGYASDWLIGDNKTGEIARFELGLKNHSLERTKDGRYFGSNFPVSPKLIREETHFDASDPSSSPNARKARWEQLLEGHKGTIDVALAKRFQNDHFDVVTGREDPNERTLCGHVEISPRGIPEWDWGPYFPGGTVQAKVADAEMAERMAFWGQIGHEGSDFDAEAFLKQHKKHEWMRGLLKDMKCGPWARFETGMKPAPR